ncbi:DUF3135 domain-containing protein [Beggiatoa alba]|nr:DUF3135 domain-containing protein [Beggiatoa alba]
MSSKQRNSTRKHPRHPDFEELLTLAKEDPALFEARRLEYIESFLTHIPIEKQRRLRGLQWQIDQARNLARTPMSSCITIMSMMWDSLHLLNDHQRTLVDMTTRQKPAFEPVTPPPTPKAVVIPFPMR